MNLHLIMAKQQRILRASNGAVDSGHGLMPYCSSPPSYFNLMPEATG